MKNWNAEVKRDITDIADGYYADNAPYWEVVIAVREWVEQMERDGPQLFGSKQAYLDERLSDLISSEVNPETVEDSPAEGDPDNHDHR